MPHNTAAGFVISALSGALGFALVWHMWLLAGLALLATLGVAIAHTLKPERAHHIGAAQVQDSEDQRSLLLARHA